jgi:C1A family cysteine protease
MPDQKGTNIRIAMKALQEEGVADANKNNYKIESYASAKSVEELKYSLVANGFVVIGIDVFDSFYTPVHGVIEYKEGETSHGLHALLLGAYDDNEQKFIIKNSWGTDWGLGGYSYVTYKYIEKSLNDAWTSVDLENPKSVASSLFNITRLREDFIIAKN